MTPNGVGSCFDAVHDDCASNFFCAYHNFFVDTDVEDVIYANEPYMGPTARCNDPDQGYPNDVDSDTTINTISHEHNEAITDPLTIPITSRGSPRTEVEVADLCVGGYGRDGNGRRRLQPGDQRPPLRVAAGVQQRGRRLRAAPRRTCTPATFSSGPLSLPGGPVMHTNTTYAIYWLPPRATRALPSSAATAAVDRTLTTTSGSWDGATGAYSYQWQRCSSTGKSCVTSPAPPPRRTR